MGKHNSLFLPFTGVGAAHDIHSADCFVGNGLLLTKTGKLLVFLAATTTDPECKEPSFCDQKTRVFEKALRSLPPHCRLRCYQQKEEAPSLPHRTSHPNAPAERLYQAHHQAVAGRAGELYSYRTVFCLEFDPHYGKKKPGLFSLLLRPFRSLVERLSPKARADELDSQLTKNGNALRTVAASLMEQCGDDFPLRVMSTAEAFSFLSTLSNPDSYNRPDTAPPAEFVDVALSRSPIECHPHYLQVGSEWRVTTLSLKMPPATTVADLTQGLREVQGRWVLALECRRVNDIEARKIIELKQRQQWANRSRYVLKTSLKENPNEEKLKNHTAVAAVEVLGQATQTLEGDGHVLYELSLTIIPYARSHAELQRLVAEIIRACNRRDLTVIEETLNRAASYFAHLPGNDAWNVRYLHLFDQTVADLAPLYAPDSGEAQSEHFRDLCLTVLEGRNRTPFYLNLHRDGVGHASLIGQTGSGKTSLTNHLIAQFQQYNPITFIFDLSDSYKSITRFLGGAYLEVGPDRQPFTLNPFAIPWTAQTRPQLNAFVGLLINRNGFHVTTDEEQRIDEGLAVLYQFDPALRTLTTLASILPSHLGNHLRPWMGDGQHARFFDNVEDSFTVRDFQCVDFRGMRELPEVLGPLVYLLSCRIEGAIADPASRTRPKLFVNDEAWAFVGHEATRKLYTAGLKTWRKYNGTILLVTQSSSDLTHSGMFEVIADCCPTKIFLAQHELDEAAYARLFHLNPVELRLIRELRPKGELLLKQPHRSKVLDLKLDPESYWLFTTNPYEAKRRDDLIAAHGLEHGLALLTQETRS